MRRRPVGAATDAQVLADALAAISRSVARASRRGRPAVRGAHPARLGSGVVRVIDNVAWWERPDGRRLRFPRGHGEES